MQTKHQSEIGLVFLFGLDTDGDRLGAIAVTRC